MNEVRVSKKEIRISGPKAVLARCASSSDGRGGTAPVGFSFVQGGALEEIRIPDPGQFE
jgi:hypothetical protein